MTEEAQPEAPALDALPESLEAAEAEHASIMLRMQQRQQMVQQAQQEQDADRVRGIFLEGVIKTMSRPNRAARRTTPAKTRRR